MIVSKFGGTSVADAQCINKVLDIINSKNTSQVVVVSALGGITDQIIKSAKMAVDGFSTYTDAIKLIEKRHFDAINTLIPFQSRSSVLSQLKQQINVLETLHEGVFLLRELSPKTLDAMISFGETLSYYIIAQAAIARGYDVVGKNARDLIITHQVNGRNNVDYLTTNANIQHYFNSSKHSITILPGFVSQNLEGNPTTLGRGGSDLTAAIIACALEVERLEIWTDVSGMFTANPKLVKQAKAIQALTYQEAMELSHFGAKVIYPPTLQPVTKKNIPVLIKNTFEVNADGTLISNVSHQNNGVVRGISHIHNIALLTFEGSGMIGVPGYSQKLLSVLAQNNINVVMITQASSEHSICIGIDQTHASHSKKIIDEAFNFEIEANKINPVIVEDQLSIVALVGEQMKNYQGISGKMFSALGKNNVNVKAIAQGASEKNITAVIDSSDIKKALNILHEAFFEKQVKLLNLFVTGVGNVGSKLLEQIEAQRSYLNEHLKLNIRVVGMANSRKMYANDQGIDLTSWKETLERGEDSNKMDFFKKAKSFNLRNSIFVDNTASEDIAAVYSNYLENSMGVVTCNKIAAADALAHYKNLKKLSRNFNAPYLFETNVGAGLPIIDTLNNLVASGDKIHTIQAVLSGSLNFVFNHFSDQISFRKVVEMAMNEGYTEPDPKIDLSGVDVARKILILARESGYSLELDDIQNNAFLPSDCLNTKNNEDFLASLDKYSAHFEAMYNKASANNCRLKYVAEFREGKAQVGIKEIPKGHDFYNLEGSDNIVLFYTDRYASHPLMVKGAGAGADVTASGIFADIIRIGKR